MKTIDLHVHSNASDGTLTPTELVDLAITKQLSAFALTDHDTVSGIIEAKNACKDKDLELISGVELSARHDNREIHILGFMIDETDPKLNERLIEVAKEREERNEKMVANLANAGCHISMESMISHFGNAILTRAHFAKELLMAGDVNSMDEAFKKYLGTDSPYFVMRKYLSPMDAIQLIQKAGGVPVLAHPLLYKYDQYGVERLVASVKEMEIVGIEAIYSANSQADEVFLKKLANKYDLLITGGSDFHGENKPSLQLGTGYGGLCIPYELLDKMRDSIGR